MEHGDQPRFGPPPLAVMIASSYVSFIHHSALHLARRRRFSAAPVDVKPPAHVANLLHQLLRRPQEPRPLENRRVACERPDRKRASRHRIGARNSTNDVILYTLVAEDLRSAPAGACCVGSIPVVRRQRQR